MKNFRFTDSSLRKLPAPTTGQFVLHYDSEVSGLCLRVMASGSRVFVLRYRTKSGRVRYVSIGRFSMIAKFPEWSADAARKRADEFKKRIRLGHDPLDDARAEREAQTVQDLIERYLDDGLPRRNGSEPLRPSTQRDFRNCLGHDFGPLAKIPLKELTDDDVNAWHRKISKRAPSRANLAHSILRRMLNLAIKWKMGIDKNPALEVERNSEQKRERYLSAEELARLTTALAAEEDQQGANIIRVLLLTGSRRGEVQGMRWRDIDLAQGVWVKPASSTKSNKPHRIPLSQATRQLLSDLRMKAEHQEPISEWVFPAAKSACGHRVEIQKTWYALCKAANIKNARIHDCRHSYASILVNAGLPLLTVSKLLGHSQIATTQRYSHLADAALREATETAASIIGGKPPAEVIDIRTQRSR